jgi:hypothetical protein
MDGDQMMPGEQVLVETHGVQVQLVSPQVLAMMVTKKRKVASNVVKKVTCRVNAPILAKNVLKEAVSIAAKKGIAKPIVQIHQKKGVVIKDVSNAAKKGITKQTVPKQETEEDPIRASNVNQPNIWRKTANCLTNVEIVNKKVI